MSYSTSPLNVMPANSALSLGGLSKSNSSFPPLSGSLNGSHSSSSNGNSNGNSNGQSNGNSNGDSKASSKNLSHVPCKFFRQGVCQAGSSCPFSHATDSTMETVPCKYFQKGNCKFGLKCALAHILPDGRRVNSKSLAQAYSHSNGNSGNHRNSQSNNTHTTSSSYGGGGNSFSNGTSNPININPSTPIDISNSELSSESFSSFHQPSYSSTTNNKVLYESSYFNAIATSPVSQQQPSSYQVSSTAPSSNGFGSIWNNNAENSRYLRSYSSSNSNFNLGPSNGEYSYSTSNSHISSTTPTGRQVTGFPPSVYNTINESAIDDDEDDDGADTDGFAYQEDFVPSSLSDLLTPQELQRRGSRPSSSMPRPNLNVLLTSSSTNIINNASRVLDNDLDSENETQFFMEDDTDLNNQVNKLTI